MIELYTTAVMEYMETHTYIDFEEAIKPLHASNNAPAGFDRPNIFSSVPKHTVTFKKPKQNQNQASNQISISDSNIRDAYLEKMKKPK